MKKIIVIGGGAAGMMAAIAAVSENTQVTLLEQNEKLGKKVFITGKGRCNVTNSCDAETFFDNVVTNPKFLYSAFYGFDNNDVMDFIESAGCPLKVERGNRVFPVSDHSSDVIKAFERTLQKKQVKVRLHTRVKRILGTDRAEGVELSSGEKLACDAVILATGGLSYPATGSTGDGMLAAKAMGHTITECAPALVPFEIEDKRFVALQGLALKNVNATLFFDKKVIYDGFGEMLFTHFGISGPLILSASSYYSKEMARFESKKKSDKEKPKVKICLDLKPALTTEQLDKRILRDFEVNRNKQFKNAVEGLFPARLTPLMIELSGISPDKKVNEITKAERAQFVSLIKNLVLTISGTRDFKEAIITRGGIKIKEVNPSTMESKLVKGLYFAGEILDVDALTGGFNLQIAWSTGHLAGSSAKMGD